MLGRFCTGYRFQDGGKIRSSSRESLTYEDAHGKLTHIEFYPFGQAGCTYYLPDNLSKVEASDLAHRVEVYCKAKGYKLKQSP
jgi:hypothetical protein